MSFYSHIQKGKEAKAEEDIIYSNRMEKGVALLRSLNTSLLKANKAGLSYSALVKEKTVVFLS